MFVLNCFVFFLSGRAAVAPATSFDQGPAAASELSLANTTTTQAAATIATTSTAQDAGDNPRKIKKKSRKMKKKARKMKKKARKAEKKERKMEKKNN